MSDARIPLTVIGGYLGAGKTTLLNHVLRHADGRRYAMLVNDFGALNIDASLIESRDGNVVRLDNGCVCCNLVSGLAKALHDIQEMRPLPEHVIIEASGVADPARIGYYAHVAPYVPAGVLVVVDADAVRQKAADRFVGDAVLRQLRSADLVVVNKIDLLDAAQLDGLRKWLAETVEGVRTLEVSHAEIPAGLLLDVSPQMPTAPASHDHGPRYVSWSFSSERSFQEAALRQLIDGWPESLLRAKGFVYLADDPAHRYVLQLMGRRWTLTRNEAWSQTPRNEIVLIGLADHLEGDALVRALESLQTQEEALHESNNPG